MYTPAAAGHGAREAPREVEQGDIDELVTLTAECLEEKTGGYWLIYGKTEGMTISAAAAGCLATHPSLKHYSQHTLGTIISSLWKERCPETVITYPFDTPGIENLGHWLPRHKILVVQGTIGAHVGCNAEGPVIITGTSSFSAGISSKGPLIIQGHAGSDAGFLADGPIISLDKINISRHYYGKRVGQYQYRTYKKYAALKEYVDRLLVLAKNDPLAIETEFGNGVDITTKINELVGGGQ